MNKQFRIILFIVVLTLDIIAGIMESNLAEYFSKPFIVLILIEYFLSQTKNIVSAFKKWVLAALVFSWIGDVLLMFGEKDLYFMLGLGAFLLAHIFYSGFFHRVRVKENIKGKAWPLIVVVFYYAALISFLSPYLGEMKLPVRIYGLVISFMLMLAMHMPYVPNRKAGLWMMSGALLFVISDSVLAVDKFYQSFEPAGVIIMLTYGLAQLFITEGAIQYIRSKEHG